MMRSRAGKRIESRSVRLSRHVAWGALALALAACLPSDVDVVPEGERVDGLEGRYVEAEVHPKRRSMAFTIRPLREAAGAYCLDLYAANISDRPDEPPRRWTMIFRTVRLSGHRLLMQFDNDDSVLCWTADVPDSLTRKERQDGLSDRTARYRLAVVERGSDGALTLLLPNGVLTERVDWEHKEGDYIVAAAIDDLAAKHGVEVAVGGIIFNGDTIRLIGSDAAHALTFVEALAAQGYLAPDSTELKPFVRVDGFSP